jgi:hypothetical protein
VPVGAIRSDAVVRGMNASLGSSPVHVSGKFAWSKPSASSSNACSHGYFDLLEPSPVLTLVAPSVRAGSDQTSTSSVDVRHKRTLRNRRQWFRRPMAGGEGSGLIFI